MSMNVERSERPEPDPELLAIADYVERFGIDSDEAFATSRCCLMDSSGCGVLALRVP